MSEFSRKVFVSVTAKFNTDGVITPLSFVWENGRHFEIDRILDIRKAASLKAGGSGIRYTVRVLNKEVYLFLEDGRWFMEGK